MMLLKVLFVVCCIVSTINADKILGHRTVTNFPKDWRQAGPASPDHPMTFLIALKQRNLDVLEDTFWKVADPKSSQYRQFMTIDQIDTLVNPSEQVYEEIHKWLANAGVVDMRRLGASVQVSASVQICEKLFSTEFVEFVHTITNNKIVRQFGQFSVPSSVADYIDLVSGLSEFPFMKNKAKLHSQKRALAQDDGYFIAPASIQSYYGTGSTSVKLENNSVGVIEFEDQYFSPTDLVDFSKSASIPIKPIAANHIVGSNDPSLPQLEASLDIQYVLGVALNATGWFWIEGSTTWMYGFTTHMYATPTVPYVNSISYAWNEEMQCEDGIGSNECSQLGVDSQQYVALVNNNFQKIGLRGISIVCAAGDSGANGRTDPDCSDSTLHPAFPASSPFVTSVGATQIDWWYTGNPLTNPPPICNGYTCAGSAGYEEAVSYSQAQFASGGGFSNYSSRPAYQSTVVAAYLASDITFPYSSYYNTNGRGYPDIAAFGSNVLITVGGQIEGVAGTSCSAPIVSGIFTLLNDCALSKTGKPLGFLNTLLYQMYAEAPQAFNDIITGDNVCTEDGCGWFCEGFYATKGWDAVSGLGTPHYPAMKQYVEQLLKITC